MTRWRKGSGSPRFPAKCKKGWERKTHCILEKHIAYSKNTLHIRKTHCIFEKKHCIFKANLRIDYSTLQATDKFTWYTECRYGFERVRTNVAKPHHFNAASAPGRKNYAAPAQILILFRSVVYPDPQGSITFAGSGSVTQGFRIRVHIPKQM
jgi:hypothetical protein